METTENSTENAESASDQKPKNPKNRFRIDRKAEREKRNRRRSRIIVRNISYKATDETLRQHFSQFGAINELNLLKRSDGKLVGCAFIQFDKVNDAAKAILKATKKDFLGRPVYVDWAVGKDEFIRRKSGQQKQEVEVKEEEIETEVKEELDDQEMEDVEVKSESGSDQSEADTDDDSADCSENSDEDDASIKDEPSDDDDEKSKIKVENGEDIKPKRISHDVTEGCTVFIKNIPFDATSEDLRKCCRKYGPVFYALINTDPVSGHSKGTGFAKFKSKDSADLCLAAGEDFTLLDTVMEPLPALSREAVRRQKEEAKNKDPSDSRNLYLVKEGLIMVGSKAAESVSTSDMNKRHKIEQTKAQILKNLNRFVSRNRLSIHNLPFHYDDERLRKMVIKFTGLRPHESRVMRENKSSVGFPRGKPKGFGFISFKTHADALQALRKLNNNPSVFSPATRPIVGFSIEDRSVEKIKQRRTQKSRENNPTYKEKLEKLKGKKLKKKAAKKDDNKAQIQKNMPSGKTGVKSIPQTTSEQAEEGFENFVGTAAKPGTVVKMRSSRKIREQAQEHLKRVSEQKRKKKQRKEKLMHRIEKKQIDRPKQGKKKTMDKDNFSQLVNKYKQMLDKRNEGVALSGKVAKRSKWYVE